MTLRDDPSLYGTNVNLLPIRGDDNQLIVNWRNSPRVHDNLFTKNYITIEGQEAWYVAYQSDPEQLRLIIEIKDGPVGCCGFTDIYDGSADLTIFIGEESALKRGVAGEALDLLLGYAHKTMGLHTIYAEVFADNSPAICLYISRGFLIAGMGAPRKGRKVVVLEWEA